MSPVMIIASVVALTCGIALFGLGLSELIAERVARKIRHWEPTTLFSCLRALPVLRWFCYLPMQSTKTSRKTSWWYLASLVLLLPSTNFCYDAV